MVIHLLHIGKTGGSALSGILRKSKALISANGFALERHGHKGSIEEVLRKDPGKVMFFVRHPVSRFVSAFNSRLRMGLPGHYTRWTPGETAAFALFKEPDALASALTSNDRKIRAAAAVSMTEIGHIRQPIEKWTGKPKVLARQHEVVFFIGVQETFDDDCRALLRKFRVDDTLPSMSERRAHVAPQGMSTALSERAIANLMKWYQNDVAIYDWCMENRSIINAREDETSAS